MSREAYLFFDAREPAGLVRDWPEFCGWARGHGPLGPALSALIERDEAQPAADVERDLIACFERANDWPDEAEQFLEAVLGRLFDNPTIGFEYQEPEREKDDDEDDEEGEGHEGPYFGSNCRLISRLADFTDQGEKAWTPVRERATLLLVIAGHLVEPRDELDDDPEEDDEDGISPRDRRDTELAVAVSMLGRLSATPRRRTRKRPSK
jgi:hypothetical protein